MVGYVKLVVGYFLCYVFVVGFSFGDVVIFGVLYVIVVGYDYGSIGFCLVLLLVVGVL